MSSTESAVKTVDKQVATTAGAMQATEEQRLYASVLDVAMKIGLAGIVVVFAIYVFGILEPKIPLDQVSNFWGMKSHKYLEATGIKTGWTWLGLYRHGDFLNFFPIAFLAAATIMCYIAIIPALIKKKDTIYAILAIVEVLILVGAASGLLTAGGH